MLSAEQLWGAFKPQIIVYLIDFKPIVLPNTSTRPVPEYFCLILEQIVLKAEQIVYRFELLYSGLIALF